MLGGQAKTVVNLKTLKPAYPKIRINMGKNLNKRSSRGTPSEGLREETKQTIIGIAFFVLAVFFALSYFEIAGVVGRFAYHFLSKLVGVGYFTVPIFFLVLGVAALKAVEKKFSLVRILGALLLFFSSLGIVDMFSSRGGLIGYFVSTPTIKLFDRYAGSIFLFAIMTVSLVVLFDAHLNLGSILRKLPFRNKTDKNNDGLTDGEESGAYVSKEETEDEPDDEERVERKKDVAETKSVAPERPDTSLEENFIDTGKKKKFQHDFVKIPLDILERDRGKPGVGDIKANANIIKRTLQNFGIDVEMDEISIGPSITRYALKPAEGVKLSRIIALQNDLSLALAAHPIRIEAPIPGKSLVGIEIPNTVKTMVGLGSLLGTSEFLDSEKSLLFALGRGISGKSFFANLAKMPHLLIAGATGSGKSVCIHAILTSLIYKNSPEGLRFILIDPKRVELTLYNKIPHLQTPVITDAKKAILALRWAAKEMDRRYDILESCSVRDIDSYHKNIIGMKQKTSKSGGDDEADHLPYIVIVIDELADIMSSYPRELEAAIVRLAQMSRATGIHLILSTQRPSVNVITGLIKANIPARIALQVASQIDSRTIFDTSGAEKLLGAGDMLYLSAEMSKPQRLQSAFISESEVKQVVKFLKDAYGGETPVDFSLTETLEKSALSESSGFNDDDSDDLYEEAREEVIRAGKASTSYLQRKFRIGYGRAARLIDILEERGVIGPGDGAKPREVLRTEGMGETPDVPPNNL